MHLAKGLAGALLAAALLPGGAEADVTIGSPLTHATTSFDQVSAPTEWVQMSLDGATLTSPVNGTVVSFAVRGTFINGPDNDVDLRVLKPSGGGQFVFTSNPISLASLPKAANDDVTRTFSTSVPISIGDAISLHGSTNAKIPLAAPTTARFETFNGGSTAGTPSGPPTSFNVLGEVQFNALVRPANTFSLGPVALNKKNGTAGVTATLSNPGDVKVEGANIQAHKQSSAAAGDLPLTVTPTKAAREKLRRKGKLSSQVEFKFTPSFGTPSRQTVPVTLRMKRKRRR